MSLSISHQAILYALLKAHNDERKEEVEDDSTYPHYDKSGLTSGDYTCPTVTPYAVTSAIPTTLATVITRAEDIRSILLAHMGDAFGSSAEPLKAGAHRAADATNIALITTATIPLLTATSSQSAANALLNACNAACAHFLSTAAHPVADDTNAISAADASDLATSITLATELGTDITAHIIFAPDAALINVI